MVGPDISLSFYKYHTVLRGIPQGGYAPFNPHQRKQSFLKTPRGQAPLKPPSGKSLDPSKKSKAA